MSQLDLACDAEIPTTHLGSIETGRSGPSRHMVLHLAACLDVPLRDRNAMLTAAGFAPEFQEQAFTGPALDLVRRGVETVLAAYNPNPAMAMDRHWTLLAANRAVAHLLDGAEPSLLRPPVNLLRLSLHPAGLASRIINLPRWRDHVITRLRRQIDTSGDVVLSDLLEELRDYPAPRSAETTDDPDQVAVPFRLATIEGELSFFTTTTRFGAPVDVTVSELVIEAFLPADAQTTEIMRRIAESAEAPRDEQEGRPELDQAERNVRRVRDPLSARSV